MCHASCSILILFLALYYVTSASVATRRPLLCNATEDEVISANVFYSEFRDLDAIMARLSLLRQSGEVASVKYPPRLQNIGETEEGRDIVLVRVGNPDATRKILISGLQHAREWLSAMVALRLVETCAEGRKFGSTLDTVELFVLPVVNPDGFEYTKIDRLWRKNRDVVPGSDCVGVDLNRNWGVDYGGEHASDDPCSDFYQGSSAFSTRETSAVKRILLSQGPEKFIFHLDLHTFAALLLGPWGFTSDTAPFRNKTNAVGRMFVQDMRENAVCSEEDPFCGLSYLYGTGGFLVGRASGILPDYTYSLGIMSYTLELRPSDVSPMEGFDPSPNSIVGSSETVNAALRRVLCLAAKQPEMLDISPGAEDVAPESLSCDLDREENLSPSPDSELLFDR